MNEQTPIPIVQLTPEGVQPTSITAMSLDDAARHEPPGVYTITRTYGGTSTLKLTAHLDRLEESAALAGIPLRLDRDRLRAVLRDLLVETAYPESRFRITVPAESPERLLISVEPLRLVAPELYTRGVHVQTFNLRRANARAKDTAWMHERAKIPVGNGFFQGMLLSEDGDILEGFSSNFYAIMDGALWTAGEGILYGISRQIVMAVAPEVLPVRDVPVNVRDLPRLQEAFLTSASRAVLPIVQIDDVTLGDGTPGPLTQDIAARYDAWVESHIEPI